MNRYLVHALVATWCVQVVDAPAQSDTLRVDTTWKTVILSTAQEDPIVDTIIVEPETPPEFPGGEEALYRYMARSIRYPESALEGKIQGSVTVEFIVEKDGSVRHATIKDGVQSAIDEEALRVILSMPSWSPGLLHGKPVRVQYVLPIRFALD